MKEDFENVYSSMIVEDWRDYFEDLKKKIMMNGIVEDYYKSTMELEEEQAKLLSIVDVITNEIKIREKVESELIWAKVISKIDAKVLNGDTKVYERIGSNTSHRRLLNNYNTSPPSLVSFAHTSSSSLGGHQGTEEEAQEVNQSTEQQDRYSRCSRRSLFYRDMRWRRTSRRKTSLKREVTWTEGNSQ